MSPTTTKPTNPSDHAPSIPFPRQSNSRSPSRPSSFAQAAHVQPHRPEYYMSLSDGDGDESDGENGPFPSGGPAAAGGAGGVQGSRGQGRRMITMSLTSRSRTKNEYLHPPIRGQQAQPPHRLSHHPHQDDADQRTSPSSATVRGSAHAINPLVRSPSRQDAYRREKERAIAAAAALTVGTSDTTSGASLHTGTAHSPGRLDGTMLARRGSEGLAGATLRTRAKSLGMTHDNLVSRRGTGSGTSPLRNGGIGGKDDRHISWMQQEDTVEDGADLIMNQPNGARQDLARYPRSQAHRAGPSPDHATRAGKSTQPPVLFTSLIPPTPDETPFGSAGPNSPAPSNPGSNLGAPGVGNAIGKHFYFPSFTSQPFGIGIGGISFPFPSYGGGSGGGEGLNPAVIQDGERTRMTRSSSGGLELGGRKNDAVLTRSNSGTGLAGMIFSAYDSIEGRFSSAGAMSARHGSPGSSPSDRTPSGKTLNSQPDTRARDQSVDWDLGRPSARPFRHSFQALAYAAQDPIDGAQSHLDHGGRSSRYDDTRKTRHGSNSSSPVRRARVRSHDGGSVSPDHRLRGDDKRSSVRFSSKGKPTDRGGGDTPNQSGSGSDDERTASHRPPRRHTKSLARCPTSTMHTQQQQQQQRSAHPPFSPYAIGGDSTARRSFDALARTLDNDNARRQDDAQGPGSTSQGNVATPGRRSSIGGYISAAELDAARRANEPKQGADHMISLKQAKHVSYVDGTRTNEASTAVKARPGLQMTRSYTMDSMSLAKRVAPQASQLIVPGPQSRFAPSKSARDISMNQAQQADEQRRAAARESPNAARSAASRGMGPPRGAVAVRDGASAHRDRGLEAKVVLLGSTNVGKTSLAKRHAEGTFDSRSLSATVNTSLFTSKATCSGVEVRLQLWDTAGEERHRSLTKLYYRGAHAALVVYDITDAKSFADVQGWLRELQSSFSEGQEPMIFVIGSKADLNRGHRQVDRRFAREQVASWLGLSPVPERSPGVPGDSGFSTSGIDHNLTGKSPTSEFPTFRIIEPTSASDRSQLASSIKHQADTQVPSPSQDSPLDTSKSHASRPPPFRFLSILSSASRPSSEHTASRPSSIHQANIAVSRRALTGARSQSVSAATALMVMHPRADNKGATNAAGTESHSKSPPIRDRRKSEDFGSRMKAAQAAVVLETTPSLGQPMTIAKPKNRKSLELFAPGGLPPPQRRESRLIEVDEDDGWGKMITGTNVRVGELSSKSGKGVAELFLTINTQLVARRERITRERLRRERESVQLTEGEGDAGGEGAVRSKSTGSCCGV